MSHSSPATYLVWTLLSALVQAFFIFHLWSFDRFKCLRWRSGGESSGAFKRVMTYSYSLTIPLILSYALANTIIKYREGFIQFPGLGIIPKPYLLWDQTSRNAIFPFILIFSFGWSLEMVTHLEELCFWLFLVNSGASQLNWFQSVYFKIWVGGSCVALIYMPLVTIFTRADVLKNEAYVFLAGSLGSLSLTLWFTPILWAFPAFLDNLRMEGVDIATIVRLTKFAELNNIRIVFRLFFTIPFVILGIDGIRSHVHINESMLWTDFLIMVAGFGCAISSAITLVIFFPRSIEGEIAAHDLARERKLAAKSIGYSSQAVDVDSTNRVYKAHRMSSATGSYIPNSVNQDAGMNSFQHEGSQIDFNDEDDGKVWAHEERDALPPLRPLRKKMHDIELSSIESGLTETNLFAHNQTFANVNPTIYNFKSPIDLVLRNDEPVLPVNSSRLTFNRR